MAAAAIIFFAFYGFDAIATAAEETKNPGRDLSIGIVGSMFVCVIIYMAVAAAAIGALAYTRFANSPEPLALILREIGQPGRRLLSRRLGGDRAADRDPRLLLRAEPDLLRDGARRPAAAEPGAGLGARLAGPDHHLHRDRRRGARRPDPARRARRARQCRHAHRLHRGLRLHAGHAPARARRARAGSARPGPGRSAFSASSAASICSTACRSATQIWFLGAQVVGLAHLSALWRAAQRRGQGGRA